jgi:5,10-methenyltetrahydrofolate synthetase
MTVTGDETDEGMNAGSSPCLLHELDPDGRPRADPVQARDVARWRKAERERLIATRSAFAQEKRAEHAIAVAQALDQILAGAATLDAPSLDAPSLNAQPPNSPSPTVSVYWPIRGEPDLRPWMRALSLRGLRVALPVAVALGQALVFREWRPDARLARGLWGIPHPADGDLVVPSIVIAPLVGFDRECYRLGYGGGFFDRTLAALSPKPLVIGVGHPSAALCTIYPQAHDVPMDWIVTGTSPAVRRLGPSMSGEP